nr:DNA ligase [Chondromyces apiculatus]
MADLEDGESIEVQGSGSARYVLRNVGEVYSCTCPAWRNQSHAIDQRTCKHLKALRGEAVELSRVGLSSSASQAAQRVSAASGSSGVSSAAGASASAAGAAAAAPPILLANPWDNAQDLSGWWMSEKLDGVRAYWDGKDFISRLGNRYHAPAWFTQGLPDTPLDGELWGGRKRFQRTISIVRRQDKSDHWKEIRFVVFDAPALDAPFEDRIDHLRKLLAATAAPHADAHDHERCRDTAHLRAELSRVEALGGEGLMLRKPGSRYEAGRSSTLLKVKSFFDAEALVIEHQAGAGRHAGRMGALLVELPDGTRFSIGTGFSDKERQSPPPPGAIVTFRYQELTDAGVPRFPSYVAVRDDIQWPPDNAVLRRAAVHPPSDTISAAGASVAAPPDPPPAATSSPVSAPAATSPAASGALRRFEFADGTSSKFWEIEVTGRHYTVRYGRLGAGGQTKTKEAASEDAARRDAAKLIDEKTSKGYVER